jgi:hypothetical protein
MNSLKGLRNQDGVDNGATLSMGKVRIVPHTVPDPRKPREISRGTSEYIMSGNKTSTGSRKNRLKSRGEE